MKIRLIISSSLQNTGDQSSGGAGERGESGVRAWPAAGGDRGEGQHQHGDPRQHADRQGDGVHHHRVQVRHQCPRGHYIHRKTNKTQYFRLRLY